MKRRHRITRPEAAEIILEACPVFREWVIKFPDLFTLQSWQANSRGVMATFFKNFARHLLMEHQRRNTDALDAAAKAIERLRKDGNASVSTVSMRDFLESVDSVWSAGNVDPCEFLRFLRPQTRKYWSEVRQKPLVVPLTTSTAHMGAHE
jgi:hypothetical protein